MIRKASEEKYAYVVLQKRRINHDNPSNSSNSSSSDSSDSGDASDSSDSSNRGDRGGDGSGTRTSPGFRASGSSPVFRADSHRLEDVWIAPSGSDTATAGGLGLGLGLGLATTLNINTHIIKTPFRTPLMPINSLSSHKPINMPSYTSPPPLPLALVDTSRDPTPLHVLTSLTPLHTPSLPPSLPLFTPPIHPPPPYLLALVDTSRDPTPLHMLTSLIPLHTPTALTLHLFTPPIPPPPL